ncbi:hypothetical protein [Winogradskyella algicola]|uniref:hypothetical protein n=1 Tax=Winogradskyella algicola TaxID=2575815 RepID=UPI0011084B3C|nr:hypothetical protein [Winogradskyella algicola]
MKKAWYIFKEYYLFSFVFLLILISIISISAKTEEEYLSIKYISLFFVLGVLFFSTKDYIIEEYYKPFWIKKKINSSPFSNFRRKGFIMKDSELVGNIRGYIICVGIEWSKFDKRPNFYFRVLFNPMSYGRLIRKDEYEVFNNSLKREKATFFIDSIYKLYEKKIFSKHKYNHMRDDILKAIDFSKSRKLLPISMSEWKEYSLKVSKQEETFVYD